MYFQFFIQILKTTLSILQNDKSKLLNIKGKLDQLHLKIAILFHIIFVENSILLHIIYNCNSCFVNILDRYKLYVVLILLIDRIKISQY